MTIEKELFRLLQETLYDAATAAHYCAKQQGDARFPGEADTFREKLTTAVDTCHGILVTLASFGFVPDTSITRVATAASNARLAW